MSTIEAPAPGEYHIAPERTTISFTTRHLFGLAPVRGTFRLRAGKVTVAESAPESSARATISAASFDTGQSARDTTIQSARYLDVERHPDITFVSTGLSQLDGVWTLRGSLTVRGRTSPLDVQVDEVRAGDGQLRARATSRVDRYAFGIDAMKGMTGRWLTMRLDLTALA